MKQILLSVLLLSSIVATAQNAQETTIKFKKLGQPGATASYSMPEKVVTNALLQKFATAGITKKSKESGFTSFKGVVWSDVSSDKLDVYFKVDERKSVSTIYVLISKGYDNFISTASDSPTMAKLITFLNSFVNDANQYLLQQNIAAQTVVIQKANSYYESAQNEAKSLISEKEKIEKKIDQNKAEQEKRKAALDAEAAKLETLKTQVTTMPIK